MTTNATFSWNELNTRDAQKAMEFHRELYGWDFFEVPIEGRASYWMAKLGDELVAGIYTMEGPEFDGIPEHWFSYLTIQDLDASVKKAQAHGATIVRQPFEVPGGRRLAIIKEPTGAIVGWMTA